MAMLEFNFQSDVLGFEQQITVLLPDPRALLAPGEDAPNTQDLSVLYLLNGFQGNHLDWVRGTMLPRFLKDSRKRIAVVMPAGLTYYYADMKCGWKYFTYVAEELPMIVRSYLHISADPKNTHVAGMSMGGAGAMKLALTYPGRYATVSSFSGALDPIGRAAEAAQQMPERTELYNNIYGEDMQARRGSADDIMHLLDTAKASGQKLPRIYQSCGTADYLYDFNIAFRDKALALGYDLTFYEEEGVGHDWTFWNSEVKKLIDRLPAEPV